MEKLDVYKCGICGNIVEVLHAGGGPLTCCGDPMKVLVENTSDGAREKHVPVFEGNRVKVGSVAHPMQPEHYIEWIELIGDGGVCRRFLAPGEAPEAAFDSCAGGKVYAREYCNLHGLWKGEK
ncbi:MAG: desulfoferrodoxin [Synergistaceae bacterium]|jgi:superoxide reductase|nr:desulfoferrodoxin [Synergistaceae bacterium]